VSISPQLQVRKKRGDSRVLALAIIPPLTPPVPRRLHASCPSAPSHVPLPLITSAPPVHQAPSPLVTLTPPANRRLRTHHHLYLRFSPASLWAGCCFASCPPLVKPMPPVHWRLCVCLRPLSRQRLPSTGISAHATASRRTPLVPLFRLVAHFASCLLFCQCHRRMPLPLVAIASHCAPPFNFDGPGHRRHHP
jgi:hypothetical protein